MSSLSQKLSKGSNQFFSSISENTIPHRAWFALLSLSDHSSSHYLEISSSLLEYIQLIALIVLTNRNLYGGEEHAPRVIEILNNLSKVFNPGFFIEFDQDDKLSALVLIIILLIYSGLKYGLLAYMIRLSIRRDFCPGHVLVIWRWVVRLQGRVVYFFITSLWHKLFLVGYQDKLGLGKGLNGALMGLTGAFILLEFIFSFVLLTQFTYPVPTKSFLSAKNEHIETVVLTQKFIWQVLKLIMPTNVPLLGWVGTLIMTLCCLFSVIYYFTTFPHYKIEGTLYQSSLMVIVTCLNVSYLLHALLKAVYNDNLSAGFSIVMWVLLSCLLVRLSIRHVRRVWMKLVLAKVNKRKELIVHRIITAKKVLKYTTAPTKYSKKYAYSYLVGITTTTMMEMKDFKSKENVNKALMEYLQRLAKTYPSDELLKLYTAHCYAYKLKLYGLAVKLLQELQRSSSTSIASSAYIQLYLLQDSLILKNKNQHKLDLHAYVRNISLVSKFKEEILLQAKYQIDLYRNLAKNSQDLSKIFELGQKVNQCRSIVEKRLQHIMDTIPDCYLEPIALSAHYNSILNHLPHKYQHYLEIKNQKYNKYKTQFLADKLCQENLYQRCNKVVVASGNKNELAIVKYMSQSAFELYGKDVVSNHLSTTLPEYFKQAGHETTNAIFERGDIDSLDHLHSTLAYNFQGGFYLSCEQYFNLSPFLYQGPFYLNIRRLPQHAEEFIIIQENGDIIGFTKAVGQELGLFSTRKKLSSQTAMNISTISERLAQVNIAFNLISLKKADDSRTEDEEARHLHDIFTTTGEDVPLKNLVSVNKNNDENISAYHCKFGQKYYAGSWLRVVLLQKSRNKEVSIKTIQNISSENKRMTLELPTQSKIEENLETESVASELVAKIQHSTIEHLSPPKVLLSKKGRMSGFQFKELEIPSPARKDFNLNITDTRILSTSRNLLTTSREGQLELTPRLSSQLENLESPELKIPANKKRQNLDNIPFGIEEKSDYQTTRSAKQRNKLQLSKDFENALNSKYYPYYFRFLIIFFYLVLLGVFGCQIYSKNAFERDIHILEARKNVVRLVISRAEHATNMYGQVRRIWTFAKGLQNESDYSESFRSPTLLIRTDTAIKRLTKANKNIMTTMNSLDLDSQARLFENNVRIFEIKSINSEKTSITLNSFQATERLVETCFRGLNRAKISIQTALPEFSLLLINSVNDFLSENYAVTDYLVNAVNNLKKYVLERNKATLAASLCLLASIYVTFCLVVVRQYNQQKQNMIALTKLNMEEVIQIMEKATIFQTMLQEDADFEQIQGTGRNEPINMKKVKVYNVHEKGEHTKKYNFQIKYWLYSLKFFTLLAIISGPIVAKYYIINNSAYNLSYLVNQIYYIDKIKPHMRISAYMTQDIIADNTTTIQNSPVFVEYNKSVIYIQDLISTISGQLKSRDLTYDPLIEAILFGDACKYISPASWLTRFCKQIRQDFQNAGLIKFLSGHENVLENFLTQYQSSNKSIQALAKLNAQTYNSIVPPISIMVDLVSTIGSKLDDTFSQTIADVNIDSNISSTLLFFCLFIMCFLLHAYVINKVKETENEFRNVLKVFPAKLVLSNFMLKSYLIRTWKEASNSARLLNGE